MSTAAGKDDSARQSSLRQARVHVLGLLLLVLAALTGACGDSNEGLPAIHLADIARLRMATESLRLDFGDDRIQRNLVSGWSWDVNGRKNGEKFVWAVGESSSLTFRIAEVRALEMVFQCRPLKMPAEAPQAVTFVLNGHEVGTVELQPKQQQYRLVLPAEALVLLENRLTMAYRHHVSPAELRGGADTRPLAVAWYEIVLHEPGVGADRGTVDDPSSERLRVGLGGRQDYYFRLETGSWLELRDLEVEGASAGKLQVEVEASIDDTPESETRTLMVESGDRVDFPLTPERPGVIRISLQGIPVGESRPGASLSLGRAAVRIPVSTEAGPADEDVPPAAERTSAEAARPNILFYVIDTLRPDRLGAYGHERPVSPNIDALAEEGVVVDRALAHAPWTRPSMVSIMTSQWPYAHNVNAQESALPDEFTTLAELLRDGGYHTVGFISNPQVSKNFGLDQGFETYVQVWRRGDAYMRDSSKLLFESVSNWLDGDRPEDEPFLLYVHTIDPHAPYTPSGDFRERFAGSVEEPEISAEQQAALNEVRKSLGRHSYFQTGDLDLGSMPWMIGLDEGRFESTEQQTEDLLDLYDAEIAINDYWFGQLVARLREAGLWEDTLVVLVSDHGEEFGEHGHWEHARTLYRPALEVPLIFKLPGGAERPASGRVDEAQLVDLLPTVLSVAGLEIPGDVEGEPLFGSAAGPSVSRPGFSYLNLKGHRATSVTEGRWKLIRSADGEAPVKLFDLDSDPEELHNLADERPLLVGYLMDLLWQQEIVHGPADSSGTAVIDDETRRRLEALGYI